jgi:hypothetical protein
MANNPTTAGYRPAEELAADMLRHPEKYRGLLRPHGLSDQVAPLRAAIWRAMMEIENGGAAEAYETLRYAWEISQ